MGGSNDSTAVRCVLDAWDTTSQIVIARAEEFVGSAKEARVTQVLQGELQRRGSDGSRSLLEVSDATGRVDLVWSHGSERVAVEVKFKLQRDGAAPDNRLAAFFDLSKLEQWVDGGAFTSGVFLWLTNDSAYLREATGRSAEFSTHNGRYYQLGTPLSATRSRNAMPMPLALTRSYHFSWQALGAGWHSLAVPVRSLL